MQATTSRTPKDQRGAAVGMADEVSHVPYRKREWVREQLGAEGPEFEALLADPTVPPVDLARVLERRGIFIPDRTVHSWAAQARRAAS